MKNPGGKKIPRIFFGVFLQSKVDFGFSDDDDVCGGGKVPRST